MRKPRDSTLQHASAARVSELCTSYGPSIDLWTVHPYCAASPGIVWLRPDRWLFEGAAERTSFKKRGRNEPSRKEPRYEPNHRPREPEELEEPEQKMGRCGAR